jgi:polyisoprenoid-binding protein YceI
MNPLKIDTMFLKTKILIAGLLFFTQIGFAQNRYFTKTGTIYFMSHTDAIDIDGTNKQVVSFLDVKTGEIVFGVLVKSFEFTLATASEHFNETYMETHLYPKANFKGSIKDFQKIDFSKPGKYDVVVEGSLTIHGVTKEVSEKGTLEIKENEISAYSAFQVSINDYKITVPKLVEDRVAKTVDVKVTMTYKPYKN